MCAARLFAVDPYSGRNYEHRRQWVVDRIRLLSSLFAIDACAYAVMSNHYHLVLSFVPNNWRIWAKTRSWNAGAPRSRVRCWCNATAAANHCRHSTVSDIVEVWRKKLSSIGWFLRCLNQPIARQANLEDQCTGKFWECRFSSQALKTEEALLSCMAYVDLNPIRAGMAESPETSEYTSIRERVKPVFNLNNAVENQTQSSDLQDYQTPLKPLLPFEDGQSSSFQVGIPYALTDYLELVDWTGRIIRKDKRGFIDTELPPILKRLDISADRWQINTTQFEAIHARRFNRITPRFDTG